MELLLGCGSNRTKKVFLGGGAWTELVTLDFNADHKPDVVHDLSQRPWPFADDIFNEVHAYDVMEHLSQQGDFRSFFAEWSEVWRILKPGGYFFGISPHWSSPWAWGDPGHTRVYGPECLVFLCQPEYAAQIGKTAMSDYRFVYHADFDIVHRDIGEDKQFRWVLKAVKPSRITIQQ